MATELSRRDAPVAAEAVDEGRGLWYSIHTFRHPLLRPLASLRLTVVLFALSIFLVFAGTLAQIDKDIWDVVGQYFRTAVAWIELPIFFPRSWNVPELAFPFP